MGRHRQAAFWDKAVDAAWQLERPALLEPDIRQRVHILAGPPSFHLDDGCPAIPPARRAGDIGRDARPFAQRQRHGIGFACVADQTIALARSVALLSARLPDER